jgi:hypothetical protein
MSVLEEVTVGRTTTGDAPQWGLARMTEPLTVDDFIREHWEKRPLILRRAEPGYYADLLTLDDVDGILSESSLHESEVQVVSSGHRTRVGPDGIGLDDLYRRYRDGATINLKFIHRRWEPLARLCRAMSADLTAVVQVNAYLTPPGAQGFNTHYDTHDVFIAQIHGAKRWRLYDSPERLPESDQFWTKPEDWQARPVKEFELSAGDLLYLPRGTLHDANATGVSSLHLTIGVHPVTWAAIIRDSINDLISRDVRYREALPPGFGGDPEVFAACQDWAGDLIAELVGRVRPGPVIETAAQAVRARNRPPLRGHLRDMEVVDSIDIDTIVGPRPGIDWTITTNATSVCLAFHGKAIRLPRRVAAELRLAATTPRFTGRDLPGDLDDAGRIVLISSLVREGYLTVAGPAG